VNPSMGARARLPVSHGPETGRYTSSAMQVFKEPWTQTFMHGGWLVLVRVVTAGTVRDMDVEYRVTQGRV